MATNDAAAIAALRLLISEPDDAEPYTDVVLSARLAAASSDYALAYDIWTEKAAAAAGIVDVSEGGSSRKLGDIHKQALTMAEQMRQRALAPSQPPAGGVRIRRLTRP